MRVEVNLTGTPAQMFYSKFISIKCLILTILVKVKKCNIYNGSIRWQISTSIEVVLEHFSLAFTVFEIYTFENS